MSQDGPQGRRTETFTDPRLPGFRKNARIISRKPLREFADRYPDAKVPLDDWYKMIKAKAYASSPELKADFASDSFLGNHRTVFNIGGNKYRLLVDMRSDQVARATGLLVWSQRMQAARSN